MRDSNRFVSLELMFDVQDNLEKVPNTTSDGINPFGAIFSLIAFLYILRTFLSESLSYSDFWLRILF